MVCPITAILFEPVDRFSLNLVNIVPLMATVSYQYGNHENELGVNTRTIYCRTLKLIVLICHC